MTTRFTAYPEGFEVPEAAVHIAESTRSVEQPMSRVYDGGAITHTAGQAEVVSHGQASYRPSSDGTAGGDVLATLTSTYGRPSIELEPGNPASRTDVRTAERMGVIRSNGRGGWEAVTNAAGQQRTLSTVEAEEQQAAQAQAQHQAKATADNTFGVFNAEEDAIFRAEFADVPEPAFRATASILVNAVVLGQSLESAAQRLAVETGMDPAQAMQKVVIAEDLNQRIVDRALGKVGLSGDSLDAFYTEARSNPSRLQNALQFLMASRDVSHFQQWAIEFSERQGLNSLLDQAKGTDTDTLAGAGKARQVSNAGDTSQVGALQAAGFEVGTAADGTPMARRGQGAWVAVSSIFSNKSTPRAPSPSAPQRPASTAGPALTHSSQFTSKPFRFDPNFPAV